VETEDLTRLLDNYLLFAAGDAEWGRVGQAVSPARPCIIVTSIEGVARSSEMGRRLLTFSLERDRNKPFEEAKLLASIEGSRALIFRGIAEVLRAMLAQSPAPTPPVIPMPDFTDFCVVLYRLLWAFEQVACKPTAWANCLFEAWAAQRAAEKGEDPDSAGAYPRLLEVLASPSCDQYDTFRSIPKYELHGLRGTLRVATPTAWLTALKHVAAKERGLVLPERAEGLRNRLKTLKPAHGFILLTEKDDKNVLARQGTKRLWGILEVEELTVEGVK
jgi:hypothetical protein